MDRVNVIEGDSCVILSQPHGGTFVPKDIAAQLNTRAKALTDTDWHIHQLYAGLLDSATIVEATFHRYVIDANRDPNDKPLYLGQHSTSLCPITDFDGQEIYLPQQAPNSAQIEQRRQQYHAPYHAQLLQQIDRLKQRHGFVIVFDCHSIRSCIPFLFKGILPDINIGTFCEQSCDRTVQDIVVASFAQADAQTEAQTNNYRYVVNGRFKGGWTTRHYGQPASSVHAIQLELAQHTYMLEKAPWSYQYDKARRLQHCLAKCLAKLSHLHL